MGKKLVDPNRLCMGCMEILEHPERPCPKCGFSKRGYRQPENGMPLYEIIDGKYMIGKVIGMGGFGITYIGWDFYQSKRVCIKEYFPHGVAKRHTEEYSSSQNYTYSIEVFTQNTEQAKHAYIGGLKSYIKEAENLSKFYLMPGIVSVRDFFYGNHTAYIVMEYIEGINLKQLARACGGTLEPDALFQMLRDVLRALHAVHGEGMVHRDISPDNIMVNREYQAKVIDFGAARNYQGTEDYSLLLKHGYAPLEQYDRNGNQGPWTDVYSLCATIYHLLTRIKLQRATERAKDDQVIPLRKLGVALTEEQEAILMKGLAIQIEDRCQTMAELYAGLYQEEMDGRALQPSSAGDGGVMAESRKDAPEASGETEGTSEGAAGTSEGTAESPKSVTKSREEVAWEYLKSQV